MYIILHTHCLLIIFMIQWFRVVSYSFLLSYLENRSTVLENRSTVLGLYMPLQENNQYRSIFKVVDMPLFYESFIFIE